jgi:tetratricopeptide (TPR) repeat protein
MRQILCILVFCFITQWSFGQAANDLALAKSYYQQEAYEKALTYLKAAEKNGVSLELYTLKKDCYLALGDLDETADWIEENLRKRRFNPVSLHIDLMQVYQNAGNEKEFQKAFDDLKNTIYKNPNYAYAAGNDLQRRGLAQEALDVYELAEEIRPGFNFKYQKAVLYGELGNVRKMYEMYVDLLEVSPNYLNSIKQILGRNYQNTESLPEGDYLKQLLIERIQAGTSNTLNQLLIFIFIQEEAYSQAFVQLRSLDKRGLLGKSELFKLAKIATENKEYFTAKRILKYEIEKGKEHPFYEDALALQLQVENNELREKNATQEEWQDLRAKYIEVRNTLMGWPEAGRLAIEEAFILCFELDQAEAAQRLLKETISSGTSSRETVALAKIQLADILLYTGDRWDAILYYGQAEKAFEFSPIGQEAKFKRAKAAYYVGDFDWAQGIFSALKESTSKLIANDAMRYSLLITDNVALDTNTEAMEMYAKADLLQYQNKLDSSLRILKLMEIAFIDHPIQDDVLMLEAEIFERRKNFKEAEKRYWALIEEQKESILIDDALYALSQLYEGPLADKEKAMNCYERIFTKHQDGFFAADARKRFRELRGDVLN